jgi:hypothetical protein
MHKVYIMLETLRKQTAWESYKQKEASGPNIKDNFKSI